MKLYSYRNHVFLGRIRHLLHVYLVAFPLPTSLPKSFPFAYDESNGRSQEGSPNNDQRNKKVHLWSWSGSQLGNISYSDDIARCIFTFRRCPKTKLHFNGHSIGVVQDKLVVSSKQLWSFETVDCRSHCKEKVFRNFDPDHVRLFLQERPLGSVHIHVICGGNVHRAAGFRSHFCHQLLS